MLKKISVFHVQRGKQCEKGELWDQRTIKVDRVIVQTSTGPSDKEQSTHQLSVCEHAQGSKRPVLLITVHIPAH